MNKTTVILDSLKKLICYLSIMAIVVLIGTYAINYLIQKNLSEGEYWVCWKAERKSEFFNYYEPIFCERYYRFPSCVSTSKKRPNKSPAEIECKHITDVYVNSFKQDFSIGAYAEYFVV